MHHKDKMLFKCCFSNLMPATYSKTAWTGATTEDPQPKLRNAQKTPVCDIPQVNRLIGDRRVS